MQKFPDGFIAPSRKDGEIKIDEYTYFFSIPVAGEINDIVEKHTNALQGTYEILSKYCKVSMHRVEGETKEHAIWDTNPLTLDLETWATYHPAHVNILIRWMNEHIFGLKGAEARLLEARSSSTNTRS